MNQQNQVKDNGSSNNKNNTDNTQSEILEQGDIYFFYRPKKDAEEVKSIEDVRRFFMVTAPEEEKNNNKSRLYRLFIIGKKSLPEVRKTEARASERYWARVGGIFKEPDELASELFSDEFRKGDAARPVGEGKYAIVRHHQNHAELAYILEMPKEPGEARKNWVLKRKQVTLFQLSTPRTKAIINRRTRSRKSSSTEEQVKYPEQVLKEFDETENFVSLAKDTKFIDYQNAQIILIGAREGRDVIRSEMGIEIAEESPLQQSADIFNKLKVRKEQVPIRPLTEGKLE